MSTEEAPTPDPERPPLPPTRWRVLLYEDNWSIQAENDDGVTGPVTVVLPGQTMVVEGAGPAPWRAGMMSPVTPADYEEVTPEPA